MFGRVCVGCLVCSVCWASVFCVFCLLCVLCVCVCVLGMLGLLCMLCVVSVVCWVCWVCWVNCVYWVCCASATTLMRQEVAEPYPTSGVNIITFKGEEVASKTMAQRFFLANDHTFPLLLCTLPLSDLTLAAGIKCK